MIISHNATDFIGKTPLLELNVLDSTINARILAKMENLNPTSIKDRAVYQMINSAIAEGKITVGTEVIEASSGNTAIAIASLGAVMGFKTKIFMSDLCSVEKIKMVCAFGAKVILTPGIEHTKGARSRAISYCKENSKTTFFLNQHDNKNNGLAHIKTTGPEIWEQTDGKIDAVVIGLGTAGTFEGISTFLKNKNPNIKIIAFEPESSPVYTEGRQGKHKLIGIGPGFITENFKRASHNLDQLLTVSDVKAFEWVKLIAQKTGVLVGPTSAAGAWAAFQIGKKPEYKNKTIICFFCDTGERYLSMEGLFDLSEVERMD